MSNTNQRRTQKRNLTAVIDRCSLNIQHGGPDQYSANDGCYNFGYGNKDRSNNESDKHWRKKWIREDNKNLFHGYSKNNITQTSYREMMIEILAEPAKINRSQRLADKTWLNFKKDWFSNLKILRI